PFFRDKGDGLTPQQRAAVISVLARYERAGIPKGYKHTYIDNNVVRGDQKALYDVLDSYVKSFTTEGIQIKSIYLYSQSPGTGKTTTAASLLNEYIRRRLVYWASKGEKNTRFTTMFIV